MVPYARRLWIWTGLALLVGTEGFVRPPSCSALAAKVERRAAPSSLASQRASSSSSSWTTMMRRKRVGSSPASWVTTCRSDKRPVGVLRSAEQSVDGGGVMLPPLEQADEYAPFLSESICQHLDEEWLPQECHKSIGEEVARLYRETAQQSGADMTTLVLDVGTKLEAFDMGDAFVGPWDIANLVSDFLMEKMGAETSGCSTKAPTATPAPGSGSSSSSSSSSAAVAGANAGASAGAGAGASAAAAQGTFRLTAEMVEQVQADVASDFARYRLLVDFMQGEAKWDEVNTVMAVYQGYRPEDEAVASSTAGAEGDEGGALPGVRRGWAKAFPGRFPPDLRTAEGLVEALEADFPEDPDMLDGLEVIVETVYGGEAKRMDAGDPEKGIAPNPVYLRRATVCKWLYLVGFLQDDIKRAPDDPVQLAELISGRARLKNKS